MIHAASPRRTFDVHLFPVVRVKVSGIQAASHREAIEQALEQIGSRHEERFALADAEYADEISHYLVDVVGDVEYRQSQWFYSADEPLFALLLRLLLWDEGGQSDRASLDRLLTDARAAVESAV